MTIEVTTEAVSSCAMAALARTSKVEMVIASMVMDGSLS
jgi:hypothetical protein